MSCIHRDVSQRLLCYLNWKSLQCYTGMTIPEVKRKFKTLTGLPVSDKQTLKLVWSSAPSRLIKISDQTCTRLSSEVRTKSQQYSTLPTKIGNKRACLPSRYHKHGGTPPGLTPSRRELQVPDRWRLLAASRAAGPRLCHPSLSRQVLGGAALQAPRQAQAGGEVLQEVRLPASLICHLQRTHTPCH